MSAQDREVIQQIAADFKRIADMLEPLVAAWMKNRPVPVGSAAPKDDAPETPVGIHSEDTWSSEYMGGSYLYPGSSPSDRGPGLMSSGVPQIPPVYLGAVLLILATFALVYGISWMVSQP